MSFDWEALQQSALAEERIAAGQYAQAIPILESELKRRPDDDHLLLQLADTYAGAGRSADAVRLLTSVAERYAAADRPEKSIAVIKKIIRLDPARKEVYELVAAAMEGVGADTANGFVYIDADSAEESSPQTGTPSADETFSVRRPIRIAEERDIDAAIPSPLFDSFTHEELLAVMEGLELQLFDPGDIIVSEGDPGDSLFIVATGIVKAFVREDERRQRHVRTLHDGDFFGEISMLQGGQRTATVTAASRCELLELDRSTVDAITAAHPNVMRVLREHYEERIGNAG